MESKTINSDKTCKICFESNFKESQKFECILNYTDPIDCISQICNFINLTKFNIYNYTQDFNFKSIFTKLLKTQKTFYTYSIFTTVQNLDLDEYNKFTVLDSNLQLHIRINSSNSYNYATYKFTIYESCKYMFRMFAFLLSDCTRLNVLIDSLNTDYSSNFLKFTKFVKSTDRHNDIIYRSDSECYILANSTESDTDAIYLCITNPKDSYKFDLNGTLYK
jgi:hypothetical protein